jgi:molecular chaperone GrpE
MNDHKQSDADMNAGAGETPVDEARPNAAANDAGPAQPGEPDPFAVLEALNAENASLKDKALRTLADMENLRRRTEREVADAKTYGVTSLARDMLTFADNLRRAVDSVGEDARAEASPALQTFIEGIEVTERDFQSRLARHGIKKLEPKGQKFDPNMH